MLRRSVSPGVSGPDESCRLDHFAGYSMILQNLIEFAAIFGIWGLMLALLNQGLNTDLILPLVILVSLSKTAFFGVENIRQLFEATRRNLAYHHFMLLMLVNMTQIILSFGFDYHCMYLVDKASFSVELANATPGETVFEFIYFSTLNFTFFGYGDVTPQNVPAKFVTMTEVLLAFVTVIFLLSDFISLKESLSGPTSPTAKPPLPGKSSADDSQKPVL